MAFYQTISEAILQLLKDGLGNAYGIQMFYDGDPLELPRSYLPAIVVQKLIGDADQTSTQRDDLKSEYMIKLILDKENDFGQPDSIDTTQKTLERMVEGRDDVTFQYAPQTILGVLRQNYTMNNRITSQKAKIEYGVGQRAEGWTAEAHIRLTVEERIQLASPRT